MEGPQKSFENTTVNKDEAAETYNACIKFLSDATTLLLKKYPDPKGLLIELLTPKENENKNDLNYQLQPSHFEDKEIRPEDIDKILIEGGYIAIVTKCVVFVLNYVRKEMPDLKINDDQIDEAVEAVSKVAVALEVAHIPIDGKIDEEIGTFLGFLFHFLSTLTPEHFKKMPSIVLLLQAAIMEFTDRSKIRLLIIEEITRRFQSLCNSGALNKNVYMNITGPEFECLISYAQILQNVLEKCSLKHDSIPDTLKDHLKKIIGDIKPYFGYTLKHIFNQCLSYLSLNTH